MATQVQFRRGTTTQNNAFTGAIGELTVDTDVLTLRLHDGTTQGGGAYMVTTQATQTLLNKTLSTGSNWEGNIVDMAYGGTGSSLTAVAGALAYSTASGLGLSAVGSSGQVLTSGGANPPAWVNASSLTVGTSTVATLANNLAGGSAGYLPYQAASDTTSYIAPGATGTFLRSTGASTPPDWATATVTIGTTSVDLGGSETDFAGVTSIAISGTTTSTSNTTGALTIGGGVGIAENVNIGGNADIDGTLSVTGATTLGAATIGAVTAAGSIIPDTDVTYDLGSATKRFKDLYLSGNTLDLGGMQLSYDSGLGEVHFSADGHTMVMDMTTADDLVMVDATQTISNKTLASPVVTTELSTTSTSFDLLDTTATTVNAFGAATTIDIGASTGTLTINNTQTVFNSTDSIQIPSGNTAQRDATPVAGQIRYNNQLSSFEGYGPGNAWGSLGGVKDVNQDTYLLTETAPGNNEDTFQFFNNNVNTVDIDVNAVTLKNDVYVQFDTTSASAPTHSEGALFYNSEYKALTYYNDIAGISNQIGMENWIRVFNNTASTIPNGTPVYVTGATGETPTVEPGDASTAMKAEVIGLTTHDIAANSQGIVTAFGLVSGIDTSTLTAGQRVHVGPSGALQTNAPTYPYFPTDIGTCVISDASDGYIAVKIQEHTFEQFRVTGNTHLSGNVTVTGDFTVQGTQTITNQANLALDSSFIYMNSGDTIGEANTTFTGSGLDDAYFTGHFEGTTVIHYYVRIDGVGTGTGGVDTFEWSKDNFTTIIANGVDITGADQLLDGNISIQFNATTGHTSGDAWDGQAGPINIDTGWASNRNTGATGIGYTHVGAMFDVASNQFIMFDQYEPEINGNVDTSHASFSYGSLRIDALTATDGTFSGNVAAQGNIVSSSNISGTNGTFGGDVAVNGGDITTTATTMNVFDTNATTVNAFGAATDLQLASTSGSTTINNSLTVTGNFTVNGTVTTVNSTEVNLDNLIIQLGGDTPPTVNDGLDRGIAFRWYDTQARQGYFGFDRSTGYFTFVPNATLTNGTVTGTKGTLDVTSITGSAANWTTARTITLGGDLSGSVSIDGSSNVTLNATVINNSVELGANTTGAYVADIVQGSGITLSETNSGGETNTVTVNHADTSSVSNVNNSGNTFIQDLTFDTYGHVTGTTSGTVVIGDGTLTVNTGSGLTGSGTFSANQSSAGTITLSHADTSSQGSINNSGNTFIQDITLDGFGHITGLVSATAVIGDGTITINPGRGLDSGGSFTVNQTGSTTITLDLETDLRDSITHIGYDSGDYIQWSNNAWQRSVVNGTEQMRVDSGGTIHARTEVIGYSTTLSDPRLKTNIRKVENALDKVLSLSGYEFEYKHDGKKSAGVLATEMEAVLPSAVMEKELPLVDDSGEKYKIVQYDQVHALLIEAIKEQQKQIEELKAKVAELGK